MKTIKKDIVKKYVLPILIFGGIIFLATMKGTTVEKFGLGGGGGGGGDDDDDEFDEEKCMKRIKNSAKNKIKGCKKWNSDEKEYEDCDEKGQRQQKMVKKWATNMCNNEKAYKNDKKSYGRKFINWSKSQARQFSANEQKYVRELGPTALVSGGGAGGYYRYASTSIPRTIAMEVKF